MKEHIMEPDINDLMQNCSISIAQAVEISVLQVGSDTNVPTDNKNHKIKLYKKNIVNTSESTLRKSCLCHIKTYAILTLQRRETLECILSTVATDTLVLSTRPSVATVLIKYSLYWTSLIQNYYIYCEH